jgi:cell division protease FtsH
LPEPKSKPPQQSLNWYVLVLQVLAALVLVWFWQQAFREMHVRSIAYSEFKEDLRQGEVSDVTIGADQITGTITPKPVPTQAPAKQETPPSKPETPPPKAETPAAKTVPEKAAAANEPYAFTTVPVEDKDLVPELEKQHVKFSATRPNMFAEFFWGWILPIGLVVGLWIFLSRRMTAAGQSVFSFGRSKARLVGEKDTRVTFDDVAGCDEAKYELQEVVDFLKHPNRYRALGAKIPKGVLLIGPPGTGKTLLARAVAGEAGVPFFLISGSDFVEMFVGVGAARVRDMFEQAKAQAPCILFIDELDAIGRQRGVHMGMVNDEREQTLNQLLVGMDGFEENAGVIILGATNRPEVLDRALLRPGRFDRHVLVDAPDMAGREAILQVHSRGKKFAPDVDLHSIAQATPGLSGADLANLINEAALLAARRRAETIGQRDMEEAFEKIAAGPERKTRRLNEEDRRRVASHEVGHALVAAYSPHADPVHKISIVPHGRAALGYTMQLPVGEQFLLSQSELTDKIKGMLGGRAAEEIVYHEVTTGAENDLERSTALARQMVCVYGMGKSVGLMHSAQPENRWLGPGLAGHMQRDCSEQTAREVDEEVKALLADCYEQAKQILIDHREQFDRVVEELFKQETIDAATFNRLLGRPPNARIGEPAPMPVAVEAAVGREMMNEE